MEDHWHVCGPCGHAWKHPDYCGGSVADHACPKCGFPSLGEWRRFERRGDALAFRDSLWKWDRLTGPQVKSLARSMRPIRERLADLIAIPELLAAGPCEGRPDAVHMLYETWTYTTRHGGYRKAVHVMTHVESANWDVFLSVRKPGQDRADQVHLIV